MNCQNPQCLTKPALRVYRSEIMKEYLVCDTCGSKTEVSTTLGQFLGVAGPVAAVGAAVLGALAWFDDNNNS